MKTKYHQLTHEERYSITALLRIGRTQAEIAGELGRSRSTISRELRRNVTRHDGHYRAAKAQQYSVARRRRERRGSWFSAEQMTEVETLLKKKWSPEQVSAVLKQQGVFTISHETIYRHVLKDKKAGGRLYTHMRIMSKRVRKRYNGKDSRGVLSGKRHISERPIEAEKRLQIGHWEGDTVIGSDKHACVLTLVERRSGFAVIRKLTSRTAEQATWAAANVIAEHRQKISTITFDNGTEFHSYKVLEGVFPVKCYFATPYHSWERGSNENLNGLFRQYIPKGTCMKSLTQKECDRIAYELNSRPRKRHGFKTPMEIYHGS
jgi:transposase, IS30 family